MNLKLYGIIFFLSFIFSLGFKGVDHLFERLQYKMITEQICRASEARLQVGATREVVDVAHSALLAAGFTKADITLKDGDTIFTQSALTAANADVILCQPVGRDNVKMEIYFPKLVIFDWLFVAVFCVSFIAFVALKVIVSTLLRGLQNKFIDETDRRLSMVFGVNDLPSRKSPRWIEWLYKTNPRSILEFKSRLNKLETKVERQSVDLKNQAREKALKESELVQARKFKDLAHQIRHDLRQTLGVIRSSLETIPKELPEKYILSGAITSLEAMIEDLRERERINSDDKSEQLELLEVILAEVVREQRAYLGPQAEIAISMTSDQTNLSVINMPRTLLKRVITNLVRNSIESISGVGIISLNIKNNNDLKAVITLEDSGPGFSEEAMAKLFKKGFTTKNDGSGRGLSYCQEKIREWNGTIFVESRPGKTKVQMELPLTDLGCSFAAPAILDDAKSLLIVDDHPIKALQTKDSRYIRTFTSLADFEEAMTFKPDLRETLIVFDLHLEGGRKALEVLNLLPASQDFLFLTSDYLNPELVQTAQQRQFLVVPKELVGFDLKGTKDMDAIIEGAVALPGRIEMPGLM